MGPRSGVVFDSLAHAVCRLSVRGAENLPSADPASGPALVVLNHTTIVDVIVTMAALRRAGLWVDLPCAGGCAPGHRHFRVLVTDDVLRWPVSRQMAARSGVIPVSAERGAPALLAARRALSAGELVVMYPEGDTSANVEGSPRPWRAGAALLARSGVPVHAVAHHDSRQVGYGPIALSVARALTGVLRRPTVRLYAGEPLRPHELASLSRSEAQEALEGRLRQAWQVARSGLLPSVPQSTPGPAG